MDVESVFITGANRGIGLEFVRFFANLPKSPRYVFATYRNENAIQELKSIQNEAKETQVHLIKMDVVNLDEIRAARKLVENLVGVNGLTLLINNAGVLKYLAFPNNTEENLLLHFKTNTIGPIQVTQEFLPLLQKAALRPNKGPGMSVSRAAIFTISSLAGCITGIKSVWRYPLNSYRISKAGLNMAMRDIAVDLEDKGILVVMMCPGWVKTDMGGETALIETRDSVSSMLKTLTTLNETHHGAFMSRNGELYEF